MKLHEDFFRHRNPHASDDLLIKIDLYPTEDNEVMKQNVVKNCELNIPWIKEGKDNRPAIICGAGPSLKNTVEALRIQKNEGAVIFACNAAAKYLHENGIEVDYQVILDAHPIVIDSMSNDAKSHILASICHPKTFEVSNNPILFHPIIEWMEEKIHNIRDDFSYIGGGYTVANSALCIAYTMGHREIHVHGMDSSYSTIKDKHIVHTNEVDDGLQVTVEHNGQVYNTAYDLKQQVIVFLELYKIMEESGAKINIYGDGLLPDMFKAN